MRYFTKLVCEEQDTNDEFTPAYAEISEEQEGMFFLFYYNKNGRLLSDDCYFSLDEAKEQATCYGNHQFTANGYWSKTNDLHEQVTHDVGAVELEWSSDCPEILRFENEDAEYAKN